jgi:lipooligosaccharide transport system permease protein
MNGGTFETTYNVFVKMHFGKTYDAITATPVNLEDAMAGEILWAITRGLIYGVTFAIVVGALGLIQSWLAVFLLPIIVLTAWLFASLGLLYTSNIRVIDMYSFYYTIWLTPLFLFSGIFFPVSGLPQWAQVVAWCTPLYHCVNMSKGVVHGTWSAGHWIDLAWVLAVASVTSGLAIRRIRKRYLGPGG